MMARDIVDDMMAFESGEMSEKEMIKMFQRMVNTGQVWSLQGSYGRGAQSLLDAGLIKYPTKKTYDYYGFLIPVRKKKLKSKVKTIGIYTNTLYR